MSEKSKEFGQRRRFLLGLAAGGALVTAIAGLYIDKHEVKKPEDAYFTVTSIDDSNETLIYIDEPEIPVGVAGFGGFVVAATAAGALLELRREQSTEDNDSHQL